MLGPRFVLFARLGVLAGALFSRISSQRDSLKGSRRGRPANSGGRGFAAGRVEGMPDAGEPVGGFFEESEALFPVALGDSECAACFPDGCFPWSSLPHSGDAFGLFEVTLPASEVPCLRPGNRGCDVEADGAGLTGLGF